MESNRTKTNLGINYDINNVLHRENGPAVIFDTGAVVWYLYGEKHRTEGPATIQSNGSMFWYKNGRLHRDDGPAVVYANGDMYWFKNGEHIKQ